MYLILLAQDVLGFSALQTGIRLIPFGGFGTSSAFFSSPSLPTVRWHKLMAVSTPFVQALS
jgi:hypothetical protein